MVATTFVRPTLHHWAILVPSDLVNYGEGEADKIGQPSGGGGG